MRGARQLLAIAAVAGLAVSYVTARITATNHCAIAGTVCLRQPPHPYLGAATAILTVSALLLIGTALLSRRVSRVSASDEAH